MRNITRKDVPQPDWLMLRLIEIKTEGEVSLEEQLVFGTNNEAFQNNSDAIGSEHS
jgi:hypothetical protein